MSYIVFALKWRPNSFDQIVGQEHITTTLRNAIQSGRLAHAYLFSGPRGVGKTSTARIFAKSLNCKNGPTAEPCQSCTACVEITQARSLDVIEIDGASNRGIDEIRVLRENVKFAPVSGKFKIYIIDEVHMLTTEAFNALLKTLEEPPAFVKFIFATTQPHKVPLTILSRCQHFGFRRIPLMKIIEQLGKIVSKEKLNIDKDVLFAVAKASDGSLRDAEALLDQLVSFSRDKISAQDVISMLGIVQQERLFDITDTIINKDSRRALEILNNIIDSGKDTGLFLANMIEHFRNLMVAKVSHGDTSLLDLPEEICRRLSEQAQAFTLEEIFSSFNLLVNAQEMAKRINSLRIPLEICVIRLAQNKIKPDNPFPTRPEPPRSNKEAAKEVKAEEKPAPDEVIEEEAKDSGVEEGRPGLSLEEIKGRWQDIVTSLSSIKMSVATYLNEGSPISLTENILTVSFPKNYSLHKESLEVKDNKLIVENAVWETLKARLRLSFVLSEQDASKDREEVSPMLKSIQDTFNARTIKRD